MAGKRGTDGAKRSKKQKGAEARAARANEATGAPGLVALLGLGFFGLGLLIYGPALDGQFISDDGHYLATNPYIQTLSFENVLAILNPTSVVAVVVENYAPVHLLLHALEWQLFGSELRGYHVVNVAFHALSSALLVALFLRTGLRRNVAILGGLFFLVHPGNVEAVAWISQLKTSSAMALCLGAILCHPKWPRAGIALFALALLAKPTAAVAVFALAVLGALPFLRGEREGGERATVDWRWRVVAGWGVALLLFAVAEFAAFGQTAGQAPAIYPDLGVRLRSVCAISLRYVAMALTGSGLSTFHETPPAQSWLDSWWLGSLVVLALLLWRTIDTLRRGRPEAMYWVWAAVSFAPICGVIPLPFPMADRYLYFLLPGLLGGALHLGSELYERELARPVSRIPEVAPQLALVAALLVCGTFALQAHARAHVWKSPATMMADAEQNYPDGAAAKTRQAHRMAIAGDIDGAIEAINFARARGYNRLDHLLTDPAYGPYMKHPRFEALLKEMAQEWLDRLEQVEEPSQLELRVMAQAHIVLDQRKRALERLQRAREVGGPVDADVARDIENVERSLRIRPER